MTDISELQHQKTVVRWCREHGLEPYATANGMYSNSWSQINKNKALGVRRGVSDLIIFIPARVSSTGKIQLHFIEMKREKKGHISPEQQKFIDMVKEVGGSVGGLIAKGYQEAIEYLLHLIITPPPLPPMSSEELETFIHSL